MATRPDFRQFKSGASKGQVVVTGDGPDFRPAYSPEPTTVPDSPPATHVFSSEDVNNAVVAIQGKQSQTARLLELQRHTKIPGMSMAGSEVGGSFMLELATGGQVGWSSTSDSRDAKDLRLIKTAPDTLSLFQGDYPGTTKGILNAFIDGANIIGLISESLLAPGPVDTVLKSNGGLAYWAQVNFTDILYPGTDGQVLSTSAGDVVWAAPAVASGSIKIDPIDADGIVINGVSTEATIVLNGAAVSIGLAPGGIPITKIAPGTPGQVLTTITGPTVVWAASGSELKKLTVDVSPFGQEFIALSVLAAQDRAGADWHDTGLSVALAANEFVKIEALVRMRVQFAGLLGDNAASTELLFRMVYSVDVVDDVDHAIALYCEVKKAINGNLDWSDDTVTRKKFLESFSGLSSGELSWYDLGVRGAAFDVNADTSPGDDISAVFMGSFKASNLGTLKIQVAARSAVVVQKSDHTIKRGSFLKIDRAT